MFCNLSNSAMIVHIGGTRALSNNINEFVFDLYYQSILKVTHRGMSNLMLAEDVCRKWV
jgi:hypothetical protein